MAGKDDKKVEETKAGMKGTRKGAAKAAEPLAKARPVARPPEKSELELDDETRRLLLARKKNKASLPHFRRPNWHMKAKFSLSWRKPRGNHSKMRRQVKAKGSIVKIGFGSPAKVNGLHPSGYEEVLVYRPEDVKSVTKTQAIRVGGTVGKRKQAEIEKLAKELSIKVLNPLNTFEEAQ